MQWIIEQRRWLWMALAAGISLWGAGHAVIYKRDVRAAVGWVALILALPPWGTAIYLVLGVNRLRRRASQLRAGAELYRQGDAAFVVSPDQQRELMTDEDRHLAQLDRLIGSVVDAPLLSGNHILPIDSGVEAYRRMLSAIGSARRTVALATYIFDDDSAGREFVDALAAAAERGVEVRVLIDAVGERYSRRRISRRLRRAGVRTALFNRSRLPWRMAYANLRNHRKLLLVDGERAFTGGMNIRQGHRFELDPPAPIRDLHFEVTGPVVATLRRVFAEDWTFTTGELLVSEGWFPPLQPTGEALARGIADGPDESLEFLPWTLLSALSTARRRVCIVTPYFLPDRVLVTALVLAARRGVEVEIVLPERGNLRLVQWASTAQLWQVLEGGCRVFLSPPPFDHTKLMLVDGCWALVGSANWDPRSLRLNFELDLEVYSGALADQLATAFAQRRLSARETSLAEVDSRSLPIRLRDSTARLLQPYL